MACERDEFKAQGEIAMWIKQEAEQQSQVDWREKNK